LRITKVCLTSNAAFVRRPCRSSAYISQLAISITSTKLAIGLPTFRTPSQKYCHILPCTLELGTFESDRSGLYFSLHALCRSRDVNIEPTSRVILQLIRVGPEESTRVPAFVLFVRKSVLGQLVEPCAVWVGPSRARLTFWEHSDKICQYCYCDYLTIPVMVILQVASPASPLWLTSGHPYCSR
jgi:hypothetical protein